jgi:hypothetical protein
MTAALRAELRRLRFRLFGMSVMHHDVRNSRNVAASAKRATTRDGVTDKPLETSGFHASLDSRAASNVS